MLNLNVVQIEWIKLISGVMQTISLVRPDSDVRQVVDNLQDPILRGHLCLSMGKSSRFMIQVAIIVSLWEYKTRPLGNNLN